jgi:hypothetical protein
VIRSFAFAIPTYDPEEVLTALQFISMLPNFKSYVLYFVSLKPEPSDAARDASPLNPT